MSTESIQNPSKTLHKNYESYGVFISGLNGESVNALNQGQAVYISGNKTLKAKTLGTQHAIGIVNVGAVAGAKLSFKANILCDSLAKAIGKALVAGAFVRYNGNTDSTTGIPEVVEAQDNEWADAVVWNGAAQNGELTIFVLRNNIRLVVAS